MTCCNTLVAKAQLSRHSFSDNCKEGFPHLPAGSCEPDATCEAFLEKVKGFAGCSFAAIEVAGVELALHIAGC